MSAGIVVLIRALAILLLLVTASGAGAAQQVQPWVELAPGEALSVRAAVAPDAACPNVAADGAPVAMRSRAVPDAAFPVRVCEARVAQATARLMIGDMPLPTLPSAVNRIVVIGDTGCRITSFVAQDCRDPKAWPFPAIARAAASRRPDLVIHIGDYYYRETP